MTLVTEGSEFPIDAQDGSTFDFQKPAWFNENKFNLGREYFMKNRFGIMSTNLCGLIILLAIPKGLALLRATKMSNTPDTARKRYVDTILHTLSWYEVQLKNDSKWVLICDSVWRRKILKNRILDPGILWWKYAGITCLRQI